jgi:hypothetical protein
MNGNTLSTEKAYEVAPQYYDDFRALSDERASLLDTLNMSIMDRDLFLSKTKSMIATADNCVESLVDEFCKAEMHKIILPDLSSSKDSNSRILKAMCRVQHFREVIQNYFNNAITKLSDGDEKTPMTAVQ